MGMDVYGTAPTSKAGEYFRNNVWWWGPLANYICGVAPDIANRCPRWHHNAGDGLGESDALALADILQAELDSGRTEAYRTNNASEIAGQTNAAVEDLTSVLVANGLVCSPDRSNFSVENVQEFAIFLRGSGGFEIW